MVSSIELNQILNPTPYLISINLFCTWIHYVLIWLLYFSYHFVKCNVERREIINTSPTWYNGQKKKKKKWWAYPVAFFLEGRGGEVLVFKLHEDTYSKKTGFRNFSALLHRSRECSDKLTNSVKCAASFCGEHNHGVILNPQLAYVHTHTCTFYYSGTSEQQIHWGQDSCPLLRGYLYLRGAS